MHFKRKPRRWPWLILVFVLLCALGTGLWFGRTALAEFAADAVSAFSPPAEEAATQPGSAPHDAVLLSVTPQSDLAPDALEAAFAQQVQFAAEHGAAAVFVRVKANDTILYRDRRYTTMPGATAEDTFFHKTDPLKILCRTAKEAGLSVYAVYDEAEFAAAEADASAQKALNALQKSVARLRRSYSIAGVYLAGTSNAGQTVYTAYTANTAYPASGAQMSDAQQTADVPDYLLGADAAVYAKPSELSSHLADPHCLGAVFDYTQSAQNETLYSFLASALDTAAPVPVVLDYTPYTQLAVTYPQDGAVFSSPNVYLMGTSNPAAPLTLNGESVERKAQSGAFGVLTALSEGENTLTFAQSGATKVLTLTYNKPAPATGGGEPSGDGTEEVPEGTYVRIKNWIASLLYDPASDDNISETVRQGSIARVAHCVETIRSGKKSWAYQLDSGDYVMAYNVELVGDDYKEPAFTRAAAQQTAAGETLTFAGTGTPVAYTRAEGNTLVLHFYNASVADGFAVTGSQMIAKTSAQNSAHSADIVLEFAAPLYGWSIEAVDDATVLTLKRTPVQSSTFAKPLAGVSVLLDAGHGEDDSGAMGVAGANGPVEKDVNLAVTLAAKYRLEQLGATVYTIRSDDTFLSLVERNQKISEYQPDFFIAIHHNSVELTVDANEQTGTECYYFYESGKPLAEVLTQNVTRAVERMDRGAAWGYYYVTRNTTCPAVLLELGFMVNPAEYDEITSVPVIWREADAIAQSILACVPKAG